MSNPIDVNTSKVYALGRGWIKPAALMQGDYVRQDDQWVLFGGYDMTEKLTDEALEVHIEALMDAQQDINLTANETMSQPLCNAAALLDVTESLLRELLAFRRATPADDLRAAAEPDYCYNPEDWEYTQPWDTRHELAESILDYGRSTVPVRISTLISAPDKWVARIPLDTDGDGEADDWEDQWFDSEEEALAALAQKGDA